MTKEKTIDRDAVVTRRDAVKMTALAVGAVALGSAGVAGGGIAAPEEALAAAKKKYACSACGKKYSSKAKANACAKKQEKAFRKKAEVIYKSAVKDFKKTAPSISKPKLGGHDDVPEYSFITAWSPAALSDVCKKYNQQLWRAAQDTAPLAFGDAASIGLLYVTSSNPSGVQIKADGVVQLFSVSDYADGLTRTIAPGKSVKVRFRCELLDRGSIMSWNDDASGAKLHSFCSIAKSKWSKWVTVTNSSKEHACDIELWGKAGNDAWSN